jgi:hypothetical protein
LLFPLAETNDFTLLVLVNRLLEFTDRAETNDAASLLLLLSLWELLFPLLLSELLLLLLTLAIMTPLIRRKSSFQDLGNNTRS